MQITAGKFRIRRPGQVDWPSVILWSMTIVLALMLIVSRMGRSLWLDEALTLTLAKGSFAQLLDSVLNYQPTPLPYYAAAWSFSKVFGTDEVALRAVSLFFAIFSIGAFYLCAREFSSPALSRTGTLVFAAVALRAGVAFSARPYSMGLALSLLATWLFIRWIKHPTWARAFAYSLGLALVACTHFMLLSVAAFHLSLLVAFPNIRERLKQSSLQLGTMFFVTALLLLPVAKHFLFAVSHSNGLTFIGMPGPKEVVKALFLPYGPVLLIAAILPVLFSSVRSTQRPVAPSYVKISALWLLVPVAVFALGSYVLNRAIFVPRYFTWQLPAFALVGAAILHHYQTHLRSFATAALCAAFLIIGDVHSPWLFENWRSAIASLQEMNAKEQHPVFLYSGLIESSQLDWLVNDEAGRILLSGPAGAYGLTPQPILLPYDNQAKPLKAYLDYSIAKAALEDDTVYLLVRVMPRVQQPGLPETTTNQIFIDEFAAFDFAPQESWSYGDIQLTRLKKQNSLPEIGEN
ncbi:MAG: glycosyltransferase family 39 protein [Bdellovibrionales bacterium]|nr:glycosyltransferase family 39 protein [Bdellovibrionales bacterium]